MGFSEGSKGGKERCITTLKAISTLIVSKAHTEHNILCVSAAMGFLTA